MKILVVDTNYVQGLNRVFAISKIRYWQKKGAQVTVFGTGETEKAYRRHLKNISYISLDYQHTFSNAYNLIWDFLRVNLVALQKLDLLRDKYDIVYSQSGVIDFLIIPWVIKLFDRKIRWFVMVDNIVPPPHKRPGPYLQKLIPYLSFLLGNILLRWADGIFVVTDFLKRYYENLNFKKVFKPADGYGVQAEIFSGKISKDAPRVDALYCGRLHYAKGVIDLLEVLRLICKSNDKFVLGILGIGEEKIKQEMLKKVDQYNLRKNIIFFGYKTGKEKGDIYRKCGTFLFLSYDEGCPHAVIEAFACNKLVVAYDLPIYHEIFNKYIRKGQMVLFKIKDFKGIAVYLLEGTYKKKKFSNIIRDFSLEEIAKNELAIFYT